MKRNLVLSMSGGALAVLCGVLFHRFLPGFGLVAMPMLWPVLALAACVPARYVLATALAVPFAAALVSGMPADPLAVALKFAAFSAVACVPALLLRRSARRVAR